MGGVFNVVNLHVYHYAGNNPVKYVDPDGEYAIVTRDGNNINIVIPVFFQNGSARERAQFKQAVENAWSGQFGDFTVTLRVEERSSSRGSVNTVKWNEIAPNNALGDTRNGRETTLYRKFRFGGGIGRLSVYNVSDIYNADQVMAHEAGHLMNLGHSEDEENIMRETGFEYSETFSINQNNIEDIIEKN